MSALPLAFAAAALLAAVLASIAVWAPRRLALKLAALGVAVLFLPVAHLGLAELLGRPKPVTFEWWADRAAEATVLGSVSEEEKRILLWLQVDGAPEPRAYALPWSQQLAQQLQDAQRQAAASGTGVRMRMPFEPTLDELEPRFYAMPQPALPPKDALDPPAPQQFVRPEQDA